MSESQNRQILLVIVQYGWTQKRRINRCDFSNVALLFRIRQCSKNSNTPTPLAITQFLISFGAKMSLCKAFLNS